jgi:hypothetical protein
MPCNNNKNVTQVLILDNQKRKHSQDIIDIMVNIVESGVKHHKATLGY